MAEAVFIIPLIMVIIALTWYFGRLVLRLQDASSLTRYEVWRSVDGAPGPSANINLGHIQLNNTFFNGKADAVARNVHDNFFPEEPYDELIGTASQGNNDAGTLADAYVYRPSGDHRQSRGQRQAFAITHDDQATAWDRMNSVWAGSAANPEVESALVRRHTRIGTDWTYTNNWRASYGLYKGGGSNVHHLRSLRDAFYLEFDQMFDGIDGETDPEYDAANSQVPGRNLAGLVRKLYLRAPGYRGPNL